MTHIQVLIRSAEDCLVALAYDKAADFLEQALADLEKQPEANPQLKLQLLRQLKEAYTFRKSGISDELLSELLTELIYLLNRIGEVDKFIITIYDELAECYQRMDDAASAVKTLEAAMSLMEELPENTQKEQIYVLQKLALLHEQLQSYEQAAECLETVIRLQHAQSGSPSAQLKLRLAAYLETVQPEKAEQHLRDATMIDAHHYGELSVEVAIRVADLARFYVRQNRWMMAKQRFEEAIALARIQELNLRKQPEFLPRIYIELAEVYARLGEFLKTIEFAEYAATLYDALAESRHLYQADYYERKTVDTHARLADFYLEFGNPAKALGIYQTCYNQYYDLLGNSMPLVRCLNKMGQSLLQLHHPQEAERFFQDAELLLCQLKGPNHEDLPWIRARIAECRKLHT